MSWKKWEGCHTKYGREIVFVVLIIAFLGDKLNLNGCLAFDKLNIINPLSGDENDINFIGFKYINESRYGVFRVDGKIKTAEGEKIRSYQVLVKIDIENDKDLTVPIAIEISKQINSSAMKIKEKLMLLYIWNKDDSEKFITLKEFLEMGVNFYKSRIISHGAYMMKEALRLLMELEEHLSNEMQIDYIQGPSTILLLLIFSFFVSYLMTEDYWKILTILIFLIMMLLFTLTHTYLRIFLFQLYNFITDPTKILDRPDIFFLFFILMISPFFIFFIIKKSLKTENYSIFHQVINSFRTRKIRTFLLFLTICIVGSASMIHSSVFITTFIPTKNLTAASSVPYGIVIHKYALDYYSSDQPNGYILPLQEAEVLWLANFFGNKYNLCGIKNVSITFLNISIENLYLASSNINYLKKYCNFNVSLIVNPQENSINWIIVSNELLKKMGSNIGDYILVDQHPLQIIGNFSGQQIKILKDINSYPIFPLLYSQTPRYLYDFQIDLITSDHIFKKFSTNFSKVSFILDKNIISIIDQPLSRILCIGTDIHQTFLRKISYGPVIYHITGFTYLINIINNYNIKESLATNRTLEIKASWLAQAILTLIGGAIIYQSAITIVYEKRNDFKIMSTLGANPSFITFTLFSEAIIIGIIAGIISYVLGYEVIYLINFLFPDKIIAFPSGLFHMFIVVSESVFTTSIGYFIPVKEAIRLVIPSGMLQREIGKISNWEEDKITLETPLRTDAGEIAYLKSFLRYEFPTFFQLSMRKRPGLTIENVTENIESSEITFLYFASYTPVSISAQTLRMLLTIRVKRSGNFLVLNTVLQSSKLKRLSKIDITDLLIEIRENILKFIDWKKSHVN